MGDEISDPKALALAALGHITPSLTDSFILKLRLLFGLVEALMPRVADNIPVRITTEQIKLLRAGRLTNGQASHSPHKLASRDLPRFAREPMPLINRRIANHRKCADFFWCWLHFVERVRVAQPLILRHAGKALQGAIKQTS
ncbi:MAG TPA: hypothetical protein VN887_07335 [Candidatus Angelobacter sp.]|nr:hypothetical protein [Candidatus Angelobacter sp.]